MPETTPPPALHRTLKEQRQLLNSLVGLYARQTDEPHGAVHAELRRVCGGPAVSHATVAQLQARIDVLRARGCGRRLREPPRPDWERGFAPRAGDPVRNPEMLTIRASVRGASGRSIAWSGFPTPPPGGSIERARRTHRP